MAVQTVELGEIEPRGGAADGIDIEPLDGLLGRDDLVVAMTPTEPEEIIAQCFRQIAEVAIGVDREGAVAFRQLCAVLTVDQRHVGEFRQRPAKRVVDLFLAEGVVQVVVAADHMGNAHIMVVDNDGQVVGWRAVGPQDYQIVELSIGDGDLPLNAIMDSRRTLLRRFQPDGRCYP